MINEKRIVSIVRWIARISGLCLFVFWGGFFVQSVSERVIIPFPPPLDVWIDEVIFFIMLAGFVVALKWEVVGSILIISGAFVFFIIMPVREPLFFIVTIVPAILYLFCAWRTKKTSAT